MIALIPSLFRACHHETDVFLWVNTFTFVSSLFIFYILESLIKATTAADEAAKILVIKQQKDEDDETGWWEEEEDSGASRLPAGTLTFSVCSLRCDSRWLSRSNKLQ